MRFNRFFLLAKKFSVFKGAGVIAFLMVIALPMTKAQAQDIYSISRMIISAEADDAISAKKAALGQGRELAFAKLINRLVAKDEKGKLPALSPDEIVPMIRDFSLAQEHTTDQSYRALMSVRFYDSAIKTFLRKSAVSVTETVSKPILALAVDKSSTPLLWDDENPWRTQWLAMDLNNTLRPVVMPFGDLEDILLVPLDKIDPRNPDLWKLAAKYGADEVLVAELLSPSFAQAFLYQQSDPDMPRKVTSFAADKKALIEGLYNPFLQQWILANRITDRGDKRLPVQVPIVNINQWVRLQESLQKTGLIQRTAVKSLKRNLASIEITYQGTQQQLEKALRQKAIQLQLNDLGAWFLQY